jgi:hypothetical protein
MNSDRGLRMRKAIISINWLKGSTADLGSLRRYASYYTAYALRQLLGFVRNVLKATMS